MNLGTLLITGGTGSFGQAFVKEALKEDVKAIRIYSRGEYLQWQMKRDFNDSRLRFLIGDVRDKDRLSRAMNGVDYVIHAAALKHVSFCQYNPFEAVRTNIIGSMNVVDACIDNGVKKALGISSDKAVEPVNAYGATKSVMEHIFRSGGVYGQTKFACIRSGNFVTARGNVFEQWSEQALDGEITVTELNMRRYFIPIQEIAKFALKCLETMEGGEIFIPKMGEHSLKEIIEKYFPDVKLKVVGKGEGEKTTELLFSETEHPIDKGDYYVVKSL